MTSQAPVNRRAVLAAAGVGVLGVAIAACTGSGSGPGDDKPAEPKVQLTFTPPLDGEAPSPIAEIGVQAEGGTLNPDVKLTNPRGRVVNGRLSEDRTSYTIAEPLGYGTEYTWSGTAIGTDGKTEPVAGSFTTLEPSSQLNVVVNIGDGQEVGIAAPIILKFNGTVEDKEAVERALTVTTTPPTEGSWAWLGEDNGSRVHWRPREYWAPGTRVHMDAKLYGLDHGGGAFGAADVTSDFSIGRAQVVRAVESSHRIDVLRDGVELMSLPCSYGGGDLDRNVTRSGIHVVTEKYEEFFMSNPAAGYFNIRERWAVRISNNGEFIHANPETVNVQGTANVTNGCINLSEADAERYFRVAVYGDPVEVSGTRIPLSEADGDIYDWIFDWETWQGMSAIKGEVTESSVPATPSGAPTSNVPAPR
ncbi:MULTISPECIES: L,D-transpeptidase [Gordonia]|uniref:L,D-transpeptidase n=1 Tax=Gordonia TaxID=2053 RepID=UPI0005554A23|nr:MULTISPECIES: Ig-like domain-containing protein [Gordonia]MDH3005913.1 Ig-like domain-containing protein [Gordonia alkanivorans]MDH3013594.1 Ig-like domain-containing protein [Gordonia alkanivorans]MDH3016206.1 Ig-like domain-containing protein [Gordonia alkanivorans]MDH3019687.1 Ig-like domain-containing protein [Gordonia alkanivorans]MDH3041046.1 Ig-like domain-containing protein [Gordonia alkanivorans]